MQIARRWRTSHVDWPVALGRPSLDEPALRVDSIMSKHIFTCRASDSLSVAAQIMWDHDCGCVPVIGDTGKLIGMITDRDICMAGYTQGKTLADIPVANACSRELYTCQNEELVVDAMRTMALAQVRRLPVVDADGRLVGVLSLSDLIRHVWFTPSGDAHADSATGMGMLLAAVSHPRILPPEELSPMSEDEKESLAQFDAP